MLSSCVADSSRRVAAIQTAPKPCSTPPLSGTWPESLDGRRSASTEGPRWASFSAPGPIRGGTGTFDVIDLRDAGEDRVFAAIREWGIGTESKVSVEQYRYLIFTLRDGRTVRVEMFSERADALEAAGLPE